MSNREFRFSVSDVLEGRQAPPVMPGPNPYPLWTVEWFAWKEENENYRPYHVGKTPFGGQCRKMPRVSLVPGNPNMYRCGSCGTEFPTARAQLAALKEAECRSGTST